MTSHRQVERLVATSIDFELSPAKRTLVETHLVTCPSCRGVSQGLQASAMTLRDRQRSGPRAELRTAVVRGFAGTRAWAPGGRIGLAWMALLLLALLTVTLISAAVGSKPFVVVPALSPALAAGTIAAQIPVDAGAPAHAHECGYIPESDCATAIAVGFGSIWTTTSTSVARVDQATNAVVATIAVGAFPHRLLVVRDSIWVTVQSPGRLIRIDPETNAVGQTIVLGGQPYGLVDAFGSLWVTDALAGQLLRVNPDSGLIDARIPVGPLARGVAVLGSEVWATSTSGRVIVGVDGRSGRVLSTFAVGLAPTDVYVWNGLLVVIDQDSILMFDPASGATSTVESLSFATLAFEGPVVWTASSVSRVLRRRDSLAASSEMDRSRELRIGSPAGIYVANWDLALAIAEGSVWVRSYRSDNIFRIDPLP